ncbi:hypothetical protein A2U01_0097884, partial [Trifolium medium]|nr:hypothetical protein [Trifolium medium]
MAEELSSFLRAIRPMFCIIPPSTGLTLKLVLSLKRVVFPKAEGRVITVGTGVEVAKA